MVITDDAITTSVTATAIISATKTANNDDNGI